MPHLLTLPILLLHLPPHLLLADSLPEQGLPDGFPDIHEVAGSHVVELFEHLVLVADLVLRLLVLIGEELAVKSAQSGVQVLRQGLRLPIQVVTEEVRVLRGDTGDRTENVQAGARQRVGQAGGELGVAKLFMRIFFHGLLLLSDLY